MLLTCCYRGAPPPPPESPPAAAAAASDLPPSYETSVRQDTAAVARIHFCFRRQHVPPRLTLMMLRGGRRGGGNVALTRSLRRVLSKLRRLMMQTQDYQNPQDPQDTLAQILCKPNAVTMEIDTLLSRHGVVALPEATPPSKGGGGLSTFSLAFHRVHGLPS